MIVLTTTYLLIAVRVLSMVLSAPVLGSRQIPLMIRVVGSLVISLVALPLIDLPSDVPEYWGGLLSAMLSEVAVGATISTLPTSHTCSDLRRVSILCGLELGVCVLCVWVLSLLLLNTIVLSV